MPYTPRLRSIACRWCSALLFMVALALGSPPLLSGERAPLELRAGPGEKHAVVATVPSFGWLEFTILEDQGEWLKVRIRNGQEGWLRLERLQAASHAPAASPTRTPEPAPVSPATAPTKVLPDRPPEPAPGSPSVASVPAASPARTPEPAPVSAATPPTNVPPERPSEPALSSTATALVQETPGRVTEQRTALVIGNATYERELGSLQNPVNDAEDVAATLRQLSFQVTLLRDATHEQMEKAMREFHDQLRRQNGVGLFYFAGHGAELDRVGYLIPLHSGIQDRWQLPFKAVNVNYIHTAMEEAGNRLNIIILDACRNIPVFEASDKKARGRGASPQGGYRL